MSHAADLAAAGCTGTYTGASGGSIFIDHDDVCPVHLSDGEAVCPEGHVYDALDEGGPCCPYPEEDDMEDISDLLAAEIAYMRDEAARIDAEIADATEAEKALLTDEAALLDEDWVLNLRGGW
jgi:hypothetical protein